MFFIDVDRDSKVRFDPGRFMEFSDNYDPLTSAFLKDAPAISSRATFEVQGEEARPDLVANAFYADTQYWWIVCLFNKKLSYADFAVGENVRMPDLDATEDFYFGLKAQDTGASA